MPIFGPAFRDALKEQLPSKIVAPLRAVFMALFRRPPARLVPFDELFPDVEKVNVTSPQRVDLPEAPSLTFIENAAYLQESDTYEIPEDYVAVLNAVHYCPSNNVVLRPDKRILYESLNTGQLCNIGLRDLYVRAVERISGYATPLRSLHNNYYHDLIDNYPRLLALHQPPFCELDRIQLLCPGGASSRDTFFLNRLLPPNVEILLLEEGRLYSVEHLVFTPFKTQRFAGYLPPAYVQRLRERLQPQRPSRRNRRLFLSREGSTKRFVANRDAFMKELAPLGFEAVQLETRSFDEQIELLYDAEVVIGAHGAALANLLFSPPGTKVVELFPSAYMVPHYYYLSHSLGHEYIFWCGTAIERDPGPFVVDIEAVQQRLGALGVETVPATSP